MNLFFRAFLGFVVLFAPVSAFAQVGPDASTDPFYGALKQTYLENPTILAARAELRSINETLDQAYSGFRPNIYADGSLDWRDTDNKGNSFISQNGDNLAKGAGLNVEQNLFRGGKTFAQVRAARYLIAAQRYNVFALEQSTLQQAVAAYMDVIRDRAVVDLNRKNLEVVSEQLRASKDRYEVGDISLTDVSQSQARVADANALLITAEGNLRASMSRYEEIIGQQPPENMDFPAIVFDMPDTKEQALSLANDNNPLLRGAEFFHAYAKQDVNSVFAELLPQINLGGSLSKTYDPHPGFLDETKTTAVGIFATVPLYTSGNTRSRVRQAKETANQRFMEILEARNMVRQETTENWENLRSAQAEITARQAQVEAAADSQKGVRLEAEVGERTIIDALDADKEYLNAEVALITARRNEVVAHYALAASMGLLSPSQLGFPEVAVDYEAELQGQSPQMLQKYIDIDEDGSN